MLCCFNWMNDMSEMKNELLSRKMPFEAEELEFKSTFDEIVKKTSNAEVEQALIHYINTYRNEKAKLKDDPDGLKTLQSNYKATVKNMGNYLACMENQEAQFSDFVKQSKAYCAQTCNFSFKDTFRPLIGAAIVGAIIGAIAFGPIGLILGACIAVAGLTASKKLYDSVKAGTLMKDIKGSVFDNPVSELGVFPNEMQKASARLANALVDSARQVKNNSATREPIEMANVLNSTNPFSRLNGGADTKSPQQNKPKPEPTEPTKPEPTEPEPAEPIDSQSPPVSPRPKIG